MARSCDFNTNISTTVSFGDRVARWLPDTPLSPLTFEALGALRVIDGDQRVLVRYADLCLGVPAASTASPVLGIVVARVARKRCVPAPAFLFQVAGPIFLTPGARLAALVLNRAANALLTLGLFAFFTGTGAVCEGATRSALDGLEGGEWKCSGGWRQ